MSEIKINAALVSAYLACGVMPRERTAFEGVRFDPVSGQSWARITDLPSSNDPAGLGQHAPDERMGILQIDIFHPKGTGTAPILGDAQKALSFFHKGRRLEYEGQGVLIRKSQRSQIRQEELWQFVSVDVHYTAWVFPK
ncbi:phage tail terminator-like protein [Halopseudomonas sp. SMJS2]|uniref:phage tail terminator-like protein n=1 Tax=Halopseudomonas sp. SMJS2 TaxID=3041098 RepID=UPI002452D088|nr:phage tail terminator-like protein [Halopseudomonas sp. SMJS2]WGK60509.1 phage tail terminator-like protein [Halopseudomonas sp. SMJS2]